MHKEKMSNYNYTVSDFLHVRIWSPGSDPLVDAPWVYQPTSPSGEKWSSAEKAAAWAESVIYVAENSDSLPVPEAEA